MMQQTNFRGQEECGKSSFYRFDRCLRRLRIENDKSITFVLLLFNGFFWVGKNAKLSSYRQHDSNRCFFFVLREPFIHSTIFNID